MTPDIKRKAKLFQTKESTHFGIKKIPKNVFMSPKKYQGCKKILTKFIFFKLGPPAHDHRENIRGLPEKKIVKKY